MEEQTEKAEAEKPSEVKKENPFTKNENYHLVLIVLFVTSMFFSSLTAHGHALCQFSGGILIAYSMVTALIYLLMAAVFVLFLCIFKEFRKISLRAKILTTFAVTLATSIMAYIK
jgi:cation transport ATPase